MSLGHALTSRVKSMGRSTFPKEMKHGLREPLPSIPTRPPQIFRKTFLRCGIFSFVTINAVFTGSMIWSYENWLSATKKQSRKPSLRDRFRKTFHSIVGRAPQATDIFWVIAFTNLVVFMGNNSRFATTFTRYFSNSPYGPWPAISMLLSVFSHHAGFHLFVNMYVLHNFTGHIIGSLGMEQFFAVFISGGIFSSFLSIMSKAMRRSLIPSIGASGAVCAILGTFCILEPQAKLCVPLLVNIFPHSFTAGSAAWTILGIEFLCATLLSARSPIDHAAHFGGLAFGICYGSHGKDLMTEKRLEVVKFWRQLKGDLNK